MLLGNRRILYEEPLQAGKRYLIAAGNVQRSSALFPFTPCIRLKFVRWSATLLILDSGRGDA